MANPLRARSASPPLNEVLAHWFRHCDPTRTKKPRQKAGLIISATVERDGLHESAVWQAQWPCALATQVPRARGWRRDCARVHEQRMVHQWAVKAQTMCFPRGKTKFIRPDGSIGRAPGHGVVLLGMGAVANKALAQCGLGFFVPIDTCDATVIDGEGTALAQMLRTLV